MCGVVCQMTGVCTCTGFSADRWLFGSSIVGLLVVLFVPLFVAFLAKPGICCFRCVKLAQPLTTAHAHAPS